MSKSKTYGLILTLGHAPRVPHVVIGLPGLYSPDRPTPVGGPGELSEADARKAGKNPELHVKLVEIPASLVKSAREATAKDREEARKGLLAARKLDDLDGAEFGQINDESDALKASTPQ